MAIDKLGTPAGNANTVTFQNQLDKINEVIDEINSVFVLKSPSDTQAISSNVNFTTGRVRMVLPGAALGSTTSQANTIIVNNPVANDAFMTFEITGDYTVNFGLDGTTNDLFVGGMSMGSNKYKVWHQNNDGAGSGLDADLLDGVQGANYARSNETDSVHSFTFTDSTGNWSSSNYKTPIKIDEAGAGILWTTASQNNAFYFGKVGNDIVLAKAVVDDASGAATRLVTFMGAAGVAHFGVTPLANNNTMWHAGNDGTGSGLDADTVDGVHLSSLVQTSRTISVSGLATGGGDLSADRTITIEAANGEVFRAGTDDTKALTTKAAYDSVAEVTLTDASTISIDLQAGTDFVVSPNGNRTLGNPTNADKVIGKKGRIRIVHSNRTLAFGSNWKFASGEAPDLSSGSNKTDILYYDVIAADFIFGALVPEIS